MAAVAVTVKKLVWFHTLLCKHAQPCIQCVADFFQKTEAWGRPMEVHACRFASVELTAAAAAADSSVTCMCFSRLHLCHLCPFDKGKTLSSLLLLLWEWLCIGCWCVSVFCVVAHFPLGCCCQMCLWKLVCLLLMYTVFTFTVFPHRSFTFCVISSHIALGLGIA